MEKKEYQWLNCAKFIAMLAVIVDHTNYTLYTNQDIAMASYFSVSLFIIISGMTSFMSNQRSKQESYLKSYLKSVRKISMAYLLATFVYFITAFNYFDLYEYLVYVLNFNISLPFYFVFLYLQLMLFSKPFYRLITNYTGKFAIPREIAWGSVIIAITYLTTNHTNMLDIYGTGGKLFGGTFLFLFYLGMVIQKHGLFSGKSLKKSLFFTGFIILWYAWWRFECRDWFALDARIPFGDGDILPSISSLIMAIIVLALNFGVFTLLEHNRYTIRITGFFSWLGKRSLYIFLYHRYFLDYFLVENVSLENELLEAPVYLAVMIFGSVAINIVGESISKKLRGIGFS